MQKLSLEKKFSSDFKRSDNFIFLIVTNPKNYNNMSLKLLKYFSSRLKLAGIYVSVNKPYSALKKLFKKEAIDIETMIVIDTTTRISSGIEEKTKKCLYLDNPENLTDLGISITEANNAIHMKDKFIFIDSVNTLLIYNNLVSTSRFMHFLTSRMRQWDIKGIIINVEKDVEADLVLQLSQFVDKVVDLTNY